MFDFETWKQLIDSFNDGTSPPPQYDRFINIESVREFEASFRSDDLHTGKGLSVSKLGKHAIDVMATKFFDFNAEEKHGRFSLIRANGRVQETLIKREIESASSFEFAWGADSPVDWKNIPGHIDDIISDPEQNEAIVEFKTCSDSYWSSLVRNGLDDFKGYYTQCCIYGDAMDSDVIFLALNRDNMKLYTELIDPYSDKAQEHLRRASELIEDYERFQTWDEVLEEYIIPEPTEIIRRGKPTGVYYVPSSLKYSDARHLVYSIYQDSEFIGSNKEPMELVEHIVCSNPEMHQEHYTSFRQHDVLTLKEHLEIEDNDTTD